MLILRSPQFKDNLLKESLEITTATENYRIKIIEVLQTDEGNFKI